jgi:hypothetical protein
MIKQKFPRGWNQKRVQQVIDYYDNQTEEEQAAEIEAALESESVTWMAVPTDMVPEIGALIAKRNGQLRRSRVTRKRRAGKKAKRR